MSVFSNSRYGLKLGGALVVVALLGVYAARKGDSINPKVWRCVVEPERWRDTPLWIPSGVIVSARETDFDLDAGDVRIRVEGRPPGKTGDRVSLAAVFRADGPRLELVRGRVLPPHHRLRWLMEAVSVVVVLGVLANFLRHFQPRPQGVQVHRGNG